MEKNETSISVLESTDGKFTANYVGHTGPVSCNCLRVHAENPGDPLRVSCCHPNVLKISETTAEICSKLAQWLHSLSADSKHELVMASDTPDQPFRLELAMRYALTALSLAHKSEDECTEERTK